MSVCVPQFTVGTTLVNPALGNLRPLKSISILSVAANLGIIFAIFGSRVAVSATERDIQLAGGAAISFTANEHGKQFINQKLQLISDTAAQTVVINFTEEEL